MMQTSFATSFADRRPAATGLPQFSLPPPDIPRIASDGISPSSGGHSGSSQSSQPGSTLYYQPQNHMSGPWAPAGGSQQQQQQQQSSYTFSNSSSGAPGAPGPAGGSQQSSYAFNSASSGAPVSSPLGQQSFTPRHNNHFGAPSPHYGSRNPSSSTNGESMANPPNYQEQGGPFPSPIGAGGPSLGSTLSPLSSQATTSQQHATLSQPMLTSQAPAGSQPPTPGQQNGTPGGASQGQESGGGYRAPSMQNNYYPPSSTPQQHSFPSFAPSAPQQSPTAHSPIASSGPPSRALGPVSSGGMAPPMGYGSRNHHPSMPPVTYGPPFHGTPGAILSNLNQPGHPMSVIGGPHGMPYHHAMHPHPQNHVYGMHAGGPPGDRPFKCDQCPQSFNRNHDLKRHKRIHLAVKPFPCNHCDKSFSRKDALKRHRLVKGCGKGPENDGNTTGTHGGSPPDRSDAMSDRSETNSVVKKES
ncbi:hypothetical protein B0H66DRAFT_84816 [Apodospora peruviana]|uniref:C2H2-type domain-containing protein n=1 Tax=Apodospora peruviana TaxID=516989 RepID=A0AAE0ITI0_9PEZI|nr:hypothetical protein B0H66DRAFT_84816 [Apodospora peruviana]